MKATGITILSDDVFSKAHTSPDGYALVPENHFRVEVGIQSIPDSGKDVEAPTRIRCALSQVLTGVGGILRTPTVYRNVRFVESVDRVRPSDFKGLSPCHLDWYKVSPGQGGGERRV